jgi:hypothetical protein
MDHNKGEAGTIIAPEKLTLAAENNPDCDEPGYDIDSIGTVDAFTRAISRQAAARAARKRPPLTYFERQRAIREIDLQERVSRLRPFKLGLAFAISAAVYAGIMYSTVGINLRSPLPPASALAETSLGGRAASADDWPGAHLAAPPRQRE